MQFPHNPLHIFVYDKSNMEGRQRDIIFENRNCYLEAISTEFISLPNIVHQKASFGKFMDAVDIGYKGCFCTEVSTLDMSNDEANAYFDILFARYGYPDRTYNSKPSFFSLL